MELIKRSKDVVEIETTKGKMRRFKSQMEVADQLKRYESECGEVIVYNIRDLGKY